MNKPLHVFLATMLVPLAAHSFCGFYVAKADTKLFNKASKVVLVREDDKTVMTMANDFEGDAKDFAVVIPVPTFLEKGQIHVGDNALIAHLDAYSAPRLVEYFDGDPCRREVEDSMRRSAGVPMMVTKAAAHDAALGVKVEAQYTIGEYDILILSAQESSGLETWLRQNGYRIPAGASSVIASYLRQNMRFFVARVNLAEQAKLGFPVIGIAGDRLDALRIAGRAPGEWSCAEHQSDQKSCLDCRQMPLSPQKRTVPAPLPIDTFDGDAWLGKPGRGQFVRRGEAGGF